MSWLDRVRKALPFQDKRDTPDNLWIKCPSCSEMLFTKEYEENLYVCPRCDHHGRIGAEARFIQLLDPVFTVLPAPKVKEDPLKFKDSKKYPDRLKAARLANPYPDALTNALGTIGGNKVVLGVQDFAFMGGSMGMAVGAAFVAGADRALKEKCPFVVISEVHDLLIDKAGEVTDVKTLRVFLIIGILLRGERQVKKLRYRP